MSSLEIDETKTAETARSSEEITLRVVGGPAAGREYPIRSKRVTIGRAVSADISIPDTVISRVHVAISKRGKIWKISDLGSTNGTWVSGDKIKGETELPMNTPVRIGNTLFELYEVQRVEEPTSLDESLISFRVNPVTADSLLQLESGETQFQVHREKKKLKAIYEVQSLLTSVTDDTELFHKILELVDDVVPSNNSYLLTYSEDEEIFEPVAGRNLAGRLDLARENYISRSIVEYVKQRNEGILSVDAPNDERFHSHSLCGFNIQSVMCVPMLGKQQLRGLIYLSAKKSDREYEIEDLKLLSMIAHSAGMAIENNRLIEDNIRAERMAAIGLTAAGLSHYVKNILNGLEGSVSLLRLGIDSSDENLMNDAWEILSKNHKLMSTLVMDLLNLAKENPVELGMYNVADMIIETVDLIRAQVHDQNIEFILDPGLRAAQKFAEIDSRGFHRVLLNLLNNAVDAVKEKHGDTGKGQIEMALKFENEGQIMVLKVGDNGIGIPAAQTSKIFEMFHTGKGERGTGLGLAVSKRIIENHRGTIVVESSTATGTTFTIKIPTKYQESITDCFQKKKDKSE